MTVGITIAISAAALAVSLMTAAWKISAAISKNTQATTDLRNTFDEFKNNSRQTHKEIFHELDVHTKQLGDHEGRIKSLERK